MNVDIVESVSTTSCDAIRKNNIGILIQKSGWLTTASLLLRIQLNCSKGRVNLVKKLMGVRGISPCMVRTRCDVNQIPIEQLRLLLIWTLRVEFSVAILTILLLASGS